MESLIPEGIRYLASQGTGWVLFLFACAATIWFLKKLLRANEICAEQANALQEKRVEDTARSAEMLNTVATTLAQMVTSMRERTEAVVDLQNLVQQIARTIDANGLRWQDRVLGIERSLEDNKARLEDLQRRVRCP